MEPVFLGENGYGDMVVMSVDAYKKLKFENDIYFKLKEAELYNKDSNKKSMYNEVFDNKKWIKMQYNIVYTRFARSDINEAAVCISEKLDSPKVALDLIITLEKAIEKLKNFSYSHRVYISHNVLKGEYRFILAKNYLVFYTPLEEKRSVEILRIIYAKRDI